MSKVLFTNMTDEFLTVNLPVLLHDYPQIYMYVYMGVLMLAPNRYWPFLLPGVDQGSAHTSRDAVSFFVFVHWFVSVYLPWSDTDLSTDTDL
ncbi:hypothetical protein EDD17DRAFT_1563326 [Pisolithus thermaeus]|nr:hypothetical protein EDD17DRAFT_1563326 [Pisolithus thermaeus]